MAEKKYSIGIDYGTESARAALVDVANGDMVASSVYEYEHGVIDEVLPDGKTKLPHDTALQHPGDYIEALKRTVPAILKEAGIKGEHVIGIATDFTACTMMPIDKDGEPLCLKKEFASEPNAWVKLWKHHAAQPEADKLNEIARQRGEAFLDRYGGKISSEWLIPKIWQTLDEAPLVYEAADRFIEAADWIVLQLTGEEKRNSCTAGYKAIWDKGEGYPSNDFFKALHPRLENLVDDKLSREIHPLGDKAGELTYEMASLMNLPAGIAVAVGNVDAHVAVPAATVTTPGKMVMIMGTSTCHMVSGTEKKLCEGMCGVVEDGILPGYFGFEAGQSAVGDIFAWYVDNGVPDEYHNAADKEGVSVHEYLEERAAGLKVGESGLLALDWWNGNRCILVNADLTGMLIGYTLLTRPEEIYRALIEATAFGTRKIIDSLTSNGVAVDELYACGGMPDRNKLLMQIYADVTGKKIKVARMAQTASALGSAMFGAVAAGKKNGGYDTIADAARKMAGLRDEVYVPNSENKKIYDQIYAEYEKLHDYFGRYENPVMRTLKNIRASVRHG